MADMIEYKCLCCGGALMFDATSQKLKCEYCDSEFDIETLKNELEDRQSAEAADQMDWNDAGKTDWSDGETDNLRVYSCKSCGGQIIGDENMGSTNCPYCDNPVVMQGQFSGALRPDYVIPFKWDKGAAIVGLEKHLSGKKLLPKIFKDKNHIDEIKGVYVPFWLFDAEVDANINYRGNIIRHWDDSNYEYTETSVFSLMRSGNVAFDNVPVDGSTKMPDDLMESIEPFDFSQAVKFETAYLAGYMADKYDVDAKASIDRANNRIKRSTEEAFCQTTLGYTGVITQSSNINLSNGKAKYALYPVWLLNTTFEGKHYYFAMNGQTGKFVGDLPVDKKAYWCYFGLFTTIFSVIAFVVMCLLLR